MDRDEGDVWFEEAPASTSEEQRRPEADDEGAAVPRREEAAEPAAGINVFFHREDDDGAPLPSFGRGGAAPQAERWCDQIADMDEEDTLFLWDARGGSGGSAATRRRRAGKDSEAKLSLKKELQDLIDKPPADLYKAIAELLNKVPKRRVAAAGGGAGTDPAADPAAPPGRAASEPRARSTSAPKVATAATAKPNAELGKAAKEPKKQSFYSAAFRGFAAAAKPAQADVSERRKDDRRRPRLLRSPWGPVALVEEARAAILELGAPVVGTAVVSHNKAKELRAMAQGCTSTFMMVVFDVDAPAVQPGAAKRAAERFTRRCSHELVHVR